MTKDLARWNVARKEFAEDSNLDKRRSFDVKLTTGFNNMHEEIHGFPLSERVPPNLPTSEAIGVEYLFRQTNQVLDDSR